MKEEDKIGFPSSLMNKINLTMERERIVSITKVECDDKQPLPIKILKNKRYETRK